MEKEKKKTTKEKKTSGETNKKRKPAGKAVVERKNKAKKTTVKVVKKEKEKKTAVETAGKEKLLKKETKNDKKKYFEAIGRRKTSVARVRLFTHKGEGIKVNSKDYKSYFPLENLQKIVESPLEKLNAEEKYSFSIIVKGGGISSQAEACRHGMARALIALNPYFRKRLKKAGFLTRDPRMRERKKFGLKRARKAPQWSKR